MSNKEYFVSLLDVIINGEESSEKGRNDLQEE